MVYEMNTLDAHFEFDSKPSGNSRTVIVHSDFLYLVVKRVNFHGMVRRSHPVRSGPVTLPNREFIYEDRGDAPHLTIFIIGAAWHVSPSSESCLCNI